MFSLSKRDANLPLCDGMCLSITESVSEAIVWQFSMSSSKDCRMSRFRGLLYEEKNSQHKTVIYL